MLQSCHNHEPNPDKNISMNYYQRLRKDDYALNSHRIRGWIDSLIRNDQDSMMPDYRTREYYVNHNPFLWIDRHGIDGRADTLLGYLQELPKEGFSRKKFRVGQIEKDLKRIRNLDFQGSDNRINMVMARLEYNLTKAYLRYVSGQRFGFLNPDVVFNHHDSIIEKDHPAVYRTLYNIPTDHNGMQFIHYALDMISKDSLSSFFHKIQPKSHLYYQLYACLQKPGLNFYQRKVIMCNMERCRWRMHDYPQRYSKYILVNIPSLHLKAVDNNQVLTMRVGLGALDTKTPLLYSKINKMDVNPQWILPKSIVKKSILHLLGNFHYFYSRHFFVRDRKTGKEVKWNRVTRDMLMSNDYLVIQEGGEGNSLGRIIFRFPNNFSIYLHDTNFKDVFQQDVRDVSHGCIRVEKPFDLAVFLLKDKNQAIINKIIYSMSADVSSLGHHEWNDKIIGGNGKGKDTLDRSRLIGSLSVSPQIPVFIVYYTLYPDHNGHLHEYKDLYGYDDLIYEILKNYM